MIGSRVINKVVKGLAFQALLQSLPDLFNGIQVTNIALDDLHICSSYLFDIAGIVMERMAAKMWLDGSLDSCRTNSLPKPRLAPVMNQVVGIGIFFSLYDVGAIGRRRFVIQPQCVRLLKAPAELGYGVEQEPSITTLHAPVV